MNENIKTIISNHIDLNVYQNNIINLVYDERTYSLYYLKGKDGDEINLLVDGNAELVLRVVRIDPQILFMSYIDFLGDDNQDLHQFIVIHKLIRW